jgi:hypothetical protein
LFWPADVQDEPSLLFPNAATIPQRGPAAYDTFVLYQVAGR